MQHELATYLRDIANACGEIMSYTNNKTLEQYGADSMLRSAVERQFMIIGEATARAREISPEVIATITSASAIVGFRNRLAHGYQTIRDETVWDAIQKSLPTLLREVRGILEANSDAKESA